MSATESDDNTITRPRLPGAPLEHLEYAVQEAIRIELALKRRDGEDGVVERDGKVVIVPAEELGSGIQPGDVGYVPRPY